MRSIIALATVIALGGCAQTPAQLEQTAARDQRDRAALDRELAGLVPDKPVTCLPNFQRSQLKGYGSTLVYTVSRGLKYRTETNGCEGVGRSDDILVTLSNTGRLCQGDIARTVDRTSQFTTGGCGLGEFTPYRKP